MDLNPLTINALILLQILQITRKSAHYHCQKFYPKATFCIGYEQAQYNLVEN